MPLQLNSYPIHMSQDTTSQTSPLPASEEIRIHSVSEFIESIIQRDKEAGTETFYRGHAYKGWKLLPSIFRTTNGVEKEHLLFRDMVAHEPQSFSECKSALDYLVQMQHYGLPTRLLDLTMNPFVALYFACEQCEEKEGMVYLFSIPENNVRHYDSDTVSVLANLSKCKEKELELALYLTPDIIIGAKRESEDISFYEGLRASSQAKKNREIHEEVSFLRSLLKQDGAERSIQEESLKKRFLKILGLEAEEFSRKRVLSIAEDLLGKDQYKGTTKAWITRLWQGIIEQNPSHENTSTYIELFNGQPGIQLLLHQIRDEKPHFRPLVQAYDLVNIFVVKAKYRNLRITNQMGAFLLFGLGLNTQKDSSDCWDPLSCGKTTHAEVPSSWIKKQFLIPADRKAQILKDLALLGITESYIYPGMEQYAKELKKKYKL